MNEKEELREGLKESYSVIRLNMEKSFKYMEDNPQESDDIIELWKSYVTSLLNDMRVYSEEFNNKKIIKTITKALLFGR